MIPEAASLSRISKLIPIHESSRLKERYGSVLRLWRMNAQRMRQRICVFILCITDETYKPFSAEEIAKREAEKAAQQAAYDADYEKAKALVADLNISQGKWAAA